MNNELEIAKAMAEGNLSSPQQIPLTKYWLLDLRITGTGFAYREKVDSYVLRPSKDYLTDDVLAMCNGLPVIVEHPENAKDGVTENSFVIGSVFYPYIKESEIWAICKIWNEEAIEAILENEFTTSCSFRAGSEKIMIDGTEVSKDLPPQSANHVAILQTNMGVWDKCNPDAIAINTNSLDEDTEMAVVTEPEYEKEDAMAESGNDFQGKVLSMLDMIVGRIEALESMEKSEAEHQQATPVETEPTKPVEDTAETPMQAETETPPKATDDAEDTLAEHASRIEALEKSAVKDDSEAEQEAQIMDDSMVIAGMLGTKVVKPFMGEKAANLRRRTLKTHIASLKEMGVSHAWQGVNVDVLDDSALAIAYSQTIQTMKGIQPRASAENPIRSFIKKGHGGLSNETHFALDESAKGNYFNHY